MISGLLLYDSDMDNLDTTFQKLRRLHESIIKNEAE